jgi:hypothetical protein
LEKDIASEPVDEITDIQTTFATIGTLDDSSMDVDPTIDRVESDPETLPAKDTNSDMVNEPKAA